MPKSARKSEGVEPSSSSDRAPAGSALNAYVWLDQAARRLTRFQSSILAISPTQCSGPVSSLANAAI